MSEPNLGPPPQSSPLKSIVMAAALLAVIAFAVFYSNPHKTAELTVNKVALYAAQITSTQAKGSFGVIGSTPDTDNDLYVVVTVRMENNLRMPIFLNGVTATYTTPQDTAQQQRALPISDEKRIEEIFPAIASLMPQPLSPQAGIDPGSVAEGQLLFHFPGFTQSMWDQHKSAALTIDLQHQNPVSATLPQ